MSQEERSILWEVIVLVILSRRVYMCMCPIMVSEIELFHCTDEQQAMSSQEIQSELTMMVEFSKMYYTTEGVP
jgi:hypothetical protein